MQSDGKLINIDLLIDKQIKLVIHFASLCIVNTIIPKIMAYFNIATLVVNL